MSPSLEQQEWSQVKASSVDLLCSRTSRSAEQSSDRGHHLVHTACFYL